MKKRIKSLKCSKLLEEWLLLVNLFSVVLGCLIGSSVRRHFQVQNFTFYSPSEKLNYTLKVSNSSENFKSRRNMPKTYVAINPRGTERLPPGIVEAQSDLFLHGCVGNETVRKPNYLLALAVGIQQKDIVNKIVSKFSADFTIILFHYDGKTSEWDQFEWSKRAIHISALKQTKWWYAKRFLHPDIVAKYEYIFIWDEDLGVKNFNAEEYIKLVKKYNLDISQPAVTSKRGMTWKMTQKRKNGEVHRRAVVGGYKNCGSPFLPPCAGFVEIMAPVFSRNSWTCVWSMIQNDLVHGWGLDFAFWRCVEKPQERIGVVDAQWIQHLILPTLGPQGESINGKQLRVEVRARSYAEWKEFERRMKEAEKQHPGKM